MYLHKIKGGGARSEEEVMWFFERCTRLDYGIYVFGKDKPKWEGKENESSAVYQR